MNEKQKWEFAHIVQQCKDGQYRSINVASKIRSDAIVAAWCELNSLRINLALAVVACKELVDLMDDIVAGTYTPDSFTTQPARAVSASTEGKQ